MSESSALNMCVQPKPKPAVPTFYEVMIEFLTLSGSAFDPELVKQATSDGTVTIDEFDSMHLSELLFEKITTSKERPATAYMAIPITIFNLRGVVKNVIPA